jgi:hypothetical protein
MGSGHVFQSATALGALPHTEMMMNKINGKIKLWLLLKLWLL